MTCYVFLHTPTRVQDVVVPALLNGLVIELENGTNARIGAQKACEAHIKLIGGYSTLDKNTELHIVENYEAEETPDTNVDDVLICS